jgi:hypothetical protein
MVAGTLAWPCPIDQRQSAQAALSQALVDVLGRDRAFERHTGPAAADAVASALLNAFGNGRWSLRSAPGSAEILGKF